MHCDCKRDQILQELGQVLDKHNRSLLDGLDDLMILITVNVEHVKGLSSGLHEKCLYKLHKHMEIIQDG